MRVLLVNNHCISDSTSGATHSLRIIASWLAAAGHECRVLTTSRLEAHAPFTLDEHLTHIGVDLTAEHAGSAGSEESSGTDRPAVIHYCIDGVPVALLMTTHHDEARPDAGEAARFLELLQRLLDEFSPDLLIGCNGHPMIREAFRRARMRGITTAYAIRSYGYDDPRYFEHVDHVFTCSQYLSEHYAAMLGLVSTPLEPPIDWPRVVAPEESRACVTFVHPAPHKGLFLFARLADMLASRRPDIPILVVQSGCSAGVLNAIDGVDFSAHPQILAAPPVPSPAEYFALTRILLVPSVWNEPFGRVAAEALVNGIPAVVSDRGALPSVVQGDFREGGGGRVLPIPSWLTPQTPRLPSEEEVRPWYDAVCELWDDEPQYRASAARGAQIAAERYSDERSRARHLEYFTSLRPGQRPFGKNTPDPITDL